MEKLLAITLLLLSPVVVAQEKAVWICQTTVSTGLFWENENWTASATTPEQYLLTLDGDNSSMRIDEFDVPMECGGGYGVMEGLYQTCVGRQVTIFLSPFSGKAGMSTLRGSLQSGESRDTVLISVLQCTKL